MKIAVLGTGMVGKAIAGRLVELGHTVIMGSRSAESEAGKAWLQEVGSDLAGVSDFATACDHSELVFVCTKGVATLEALGAANQNGGLDNKTIIDVTNPLDFSKGMPPTLSVCNDDSMAEQIQKKFPGAKVVKSLNTMNCDIMVRPDKVAGDHVVFVCGNDEKAKGDAKGILGEFGWSEKQILDLGDVTAARGTEMFLPMWLRMFGALGHANFNISVNSAK